MLELGDLNKKVPFIFLTVNDEWRIVRKAWAMGCHGYLVKNESTKEILNAIDKVRQGERYISPQLIPALQGRQKDTDGLTPREMEIAHFLVQGLTANEISKLLFISARTVNNHRTNIYRKLDVNNVIKLSQKLPNLL